MAKILVADDNSNIQKMVGLALKDQGIDVVAVGNGEAAVRKIPDVKPDLILADVFMPVRNGYEVCEFVKKDPALAHIPVILLVGAFDPLDEQEAQRVGADGVLKKPFVPPDPLIAMVKAALARAGVSLTTAAEKAEKAVKKGADLLPARPVPVPMSVQPPPMAAAPQSISVDDSESMVEEVAVHPAPVSMVGGAPLAFGNLMGPTEAAEEQDPGFAAPVHPDLAMERDWRATEEESDVPEEEEEEQPKSSWRRDIDDLGETDGDTTDKGRGWRDSPLNEPAVARKSWDSRDPLPAMTEAASTTDAGKTGAATSVLTEVHGSSAAPPDLQPASPAFSASAWATAIQAGEQPAIGEAANGISNGVATNEVPPASADAALDAEETASSTLAVEHDAVATAIDRFAVAKDTASSPLATGTWEVQALKATQLAATWDAPPSASPLAHVPSADALAADAPTAESPLPTAVPEASEPAAPEATAASSESHSASASEQLDTASPETFVAPGESPSQIDDGSSREIASIATSSVLETLESDSPVAKTSTAYATEPEAVSESGAPEIAKFEAVSPYASSESLASDPPSQLADSQPAQAEQPAEHPVAPLVEENEPLGSLAAAVKAEAAKADEHSAASLASSAAAAQSVVNDAVVARVLSSLSPEVLQSITREILKPVVEAMVREELNKKK